MAKYRAVSVVVPLSCTFRQNGSGAVRRRFQFELQRKLQRILHYFALVPAGAACGLEEVIPFLSRESRCATSLPTMVISLPS